MTKLKLLAAAVGFAFAGSASAIGISTSPDGTNLFLTVWKGTGTDMVTYHRSLGVNYNNLVQNPGTDRVIQAPWQDEAGYVYTDAPNAGDTFTSLFSAGDAIRWTIASGKTNGVNPSIAITASVAGAAPTSFQQTSIMSSFGTFNGAVNTIGCNLADFCSVTGSSNPAAGGNAAWSTRINNTLPTAWNTNIIETLGSLTDAAFYIVGASTVDRFNNSANNGFWELLADGSVRYTLDSAVVGEIPEPSTWALMMAGLLGLGAIARRRAAK
jgi:hypothetical protein